MCWTFTAGKLPIPLVYDIIAETCQQRGIEPVALIEWMNSFPVAKIRPRVLNEPLRMLLLAIISFTANAFAYSRAKS